MQVVGFLMRWLISFLSFQSQYEHHKEVRAAQGVKIIGKDLEKALAGLPMYVAHDDDEVEYYKVGFKYWHFTRGEKTGSLG